MNKLFGINRTRIEARICEMGSGIFQHMGSPFSLMLGRTGSIYREAICNYPQSSAASLEGQVVAYTSARQEDLFNPFEQDDRYLSQPLTEGEIAGAPFQTENKGSKPVGIKSFNLGLNPLSIEARTSISRISKQLAAWHMRNQSRLEATVGDVYNTAQNVIYIAQDWWKGPQSNIGDFHTRLTEVLETVDVRGVLWLLKHNPESFAKSDLDQVLEKFLVNPKILLAVVLEPTLLSKCSFPLQNNGDLQKIIISLLKKGGSVDVVESILAKVEFTSMDLVRIFSVASVVGETSIMLKILAKMDPDTQNLKAMECLREIRKGTENEAFLKALCNFCRSPAEAMRVIQKVGSAEQVMVVFNTLKSKLSFEQKYTLIESIQNSGGGIPSHIRTELIKEASDHYCMKDPKKFKAILEQLKSK